MIRLKWGGCWFPESTSAPPAIVDIADTAMDAGEEEYGEVIDRPEVTNKI